MPYPRKVQIPPRGVIRIPLSVLSRVRISSDLRASARKSERAAFVAERDGEKIEIPSKFEPPSRKFLEYHNQQIFGKNTPTMPQIWHFEFYTSNSGLFCDTMQVMEIPRKFDKARERFVELMQQPAKAFLLGAGCSYSAGLPLIPNLTDKIMEAGFPQNETHALMQSIKGNLQGGNIEDYLSELTDYLAIAERKSACGAQDTGVDIYGNSYPIQSLRGAVSDVKGAIVKIIEDSTQNADISAYRRFVRTVRNLGRDGDVCADYLCLNYDPLLERALALEKIPYADGMAGGEIGWWDINTYDQDLPAKVYKLHGSVNWLAFDGEAFPRRVVPGITPPTAKEFMIWPAATKYRETQRDPYAQLAKKGWDAVKSKGDKILIICGYRFADAHINDEIEQALRDSDKRLTVVAFVGENEPNDKVKAWLANDRIGGNILVYAKKGFFHGDHSEPHDKVLPWWMFENFADMIPGAEQ